MRYAAQSVEPPAMDSLSAALLMPSLEATSSGTRPGAAAIGRRCKIFGISWSHRTPLPPHEANQRQGAGYEAHHDLGARPTKAVGASEGPDQRDGTGGDMAGSAEFERFRSATALW